MNPRPVRPGGSLQQSLLALGSLSVAVGLAVWQQRTLGRGRSDSVTAVERPETTFSDVAGLIEAKEELAEIVTFLRDPERFRRMGARMPRGVLLAGPPGTGKTLLARAVAGEAGVPFFAMSASQFVEVYVGVGAKRVRDLFAAARKASPAIVFIDEIDAIGRRRGDSQSHQEYEQTLNQVLVELDGFHPRQAVVVIAATNRSDILDPALLRPGRFDRRVELSLPDRAERAAILRVHAQDKPLAPDVDLDALAARTVGLSGADLENTLNEAALLALRRGGDEITQADLEEAVDRVIAGPSRRSRALSARERETIAVHEAGHALVAHQLASADAPRRVTILGRGQMGGATVLAPDEDRRLWTRGQFLDRLAVLLGGYAAEEYRYGEVTTGSSGDLSQASALAQAMVTTYGMGKSLRGRAFDANGPVSDETSRAIDEEVSALVSEALELASRTIANAAHLLDALVAALLAEETLDEARLAAILGPRPARPAMN
ncbi:ATP-dependent zinc metalloprotease FtsH [Sphaerobacter thermophilus]|uniref:ATP-dependent zinc metalloprotease FtsH 3 n=1 Tax=Sphaerobacter thermophilus (strain ATCC 49802 / DSM 20745 / KCCM 41009 / NCIMB 13125 / S 6022) TaxID=479434 RepID=FTSH3_SPHTD|nr:ATP-dependent zinc metalloprotease FtsH [Sphaerobacter thermophilus]D1C4U5.1 RecName: Full=ATP-dependent zinc metalloprotease FtsH 3 [Sphaerobacter thermophilus DSM 20745]ACZ39262.1 ATP-dependent metalloprotease FtsH [Sphaerobacter thermophilus DSM 20745]